jgi:hypothetical protein
LGSGFNDPEGRPPAAPGPREPSPAVARFLSCRWRKPAENGTPDHCVHPEVRPVAGTAGFVPEAWCADCPFYKARRVPKRREPVTPPDLWGS